MLTYSNHSTTGEHFDNIGDYNPRINQYYLQGVQKDTDYYKGSSEGPSRNMYIFPYEITENVDILIIFCNKNPCLIAYYCCY